MNYKKMWYQLKKQMLDPANRHVSAESVLKKMDRLEVNESSVEIQTTIKPIGVEVIMPDKLPSEIKEELEKIVRNLVISS